MKDISNELAALAAVAKHGAYRRAATALDPKTSHVTVRNRVETLQKALDCSLITPFKEGVVLTEAGERLLEVYREWLNKGITPTLSALVQRALHPQAVPHDNVGEEPTQLRDGSASMSASAEQQDVSVADETVRVSSTSQDGPRHGTPQVVVPVRFPDYGPCHIVVPAGPGWEVEYVSFKHELPSVGSIGERKIDALLCLAKSFDDARAVVDDRAELNFLGDVKLSDALVQRAGEYGHLTHMDWCHLSGTLAALCFDGAVGEQLKTELYERHSEHKIKFILDRPSQPDFILTFPELKSRHSCPTCGRMAPFRGMIQIGTWLTTSARLYLVLGRHVPETIRHQLTKALTTAVQSQDAGKH